MVAIDSTVVTIALPRIRLGLHFSATSLSWVTNAYMLTLGGLLLLGARCGDLRGRRLTFGYGIALFTIASLLGGFAMSATWLLAARAAQGVGAALCVPSGLALLMLEFPDPRARARAVAWFTSVSVGGATVGLVAGGMLLEWASWRWVFFVNVPVGVFVVALVRRALPESSRVSGRFDLTGALTSTAGMASIVYAFVGAAERGWGDAVTVATFGLGIALLAAFLFNESRAAQPITPLRLLRNRARAASFATRLFQLGALSGFLFFLSQFLQIVRGYSPLGAGLAFVPISVIVFGSSQFTAAVLMRRIPRKVLLMTGTLLNTLAFVGLSRLSVSSDYFGFFWPTLLLGVGNGVVSVPLTTVSLEGVDPGDSGAVSGLMNVTQQIGGALGLAVLISVFGHASRGAATVLRATPSSTLAFVAGVDRAFVAAALLSAASLLAATFIPAKAAPSYERVGPMRIEPDFSPVEGLVAEA
jgi:EmrB/QacA subfamily drug resistance transporter